MNKPCGGQNGFAAKILVVDDNQDILRFFKIALNHEGYGVIIAQGGNEGIKVYETEKPDLVLLDIHMPDKNGLETLRIIKKLDIENRSRVIMLTGRSDLAYVREALAMGAYDYISKPFNLSALNLLLEKALKN